MKKTLTKYQVADELLADENANWTRSGALALAEDFEEYEENCGIEVELDVVAIRCDFAEYESLEEWARCYFCDDQLAELLGTAEYEADKLKAMIQADALAAKGEHGDAEQIRRWYKNEESERADHKEETLRDYIRYHGTLIEFDGGIIVSTF